MNPIRVLHVIPGLSPKDGGPTNALHGMARASAALGAQVTVATSDDDAGGRLDVPLARPLTVGDVDYWYFARSLPGSWKPSIGLARWLSANVARFDVVHVHALFSFSTIPASRFAHRAGVPVVLRPLGTIAPWSMAHRGWKKRPYFALVERAHLESAAAIHTTSESEREAVAALGYGSKVRVIPLGVEILERHDRPVRDDWASLRLLFLGRLHPVKAVPVLLEALAAARRRGVAAVLTIAGDGTPAYRAELERLVASLGLDGAVNFVGHVDAERKRALFMAADAYVLPSYQENFGIAAAEALAAGLPVIVSDRVGIAPQIAEARAGLVVPVDEEALSAAIELLASDPRRLESMGDEAHRLATAQFSWDRTATSLLELYEELRHHARGRRRR